jgi:hypothetical protein
MPNHWYKQLVAAGVREHSLPDACIAEIEKVDSI